jgi:hypothetical protein
VFQRNSNPSRTGPSGPVFYSALLAALVGFGVFFDHTSAVAVPQPESIPQLHADLARARASPEVLHVARWTLDSGDHDGLPFLVVDKAHARLFAFDEGGRLLATAPVLLGAVRGDAPAAPATPAGRFVADTWLSQGDAIVWVRDGVMLSLHAMPSDASPGRGMQRLASDRVDDKRISDGSLHVAGEFYRDFLAPMHGRASIAYVLPEAKPARDMFAAHNPPSSRRPS